MTILLFRQNLKLKFCVYWAWRLPTKNDVFALIMPLSAFWLFVWLLRNAFLYIFIYKTLFFSWCQNWQEQRLWSIWVQRLVNMRRGKYIWIFKRELSFVNHFLRFFASEFESFVRFPFAYLTVGRGLMYQRFRISALKDAIIWYVV